MPTLNATPKSPTANSFCTRAETDTYFDERLNAAEWTAASNDDKDRSLIMATRLLDDMLKWNGTIRDETQALGWPRSGVEDKEGTAPDYDTVPVAIKHATMETALFLLRSDRLGEPGLLGQGFSKASVGSLSVEVDAAQVLEYIPQHVLAMLEPWGELTGSAARTGGRVIPLRRA